MKTTYSMGRASMHAFNFKNMIDPGETWIQVKNFRLVYHPDEVTAHFLIQLVEWLSVKKNYRKVMLHSYFHDEGGKIQAVWVQIARRESSYNIDLPF